VSTLPATTPPQKKKQANRILPPSPVRALIVIGSFTVLLYLIELVDAAMSGRLDQFGIQPARSAAWTVSSGRRCCTTAGRTCSPTRCPCCCSASSPCPTASASGPL
jgi:hypothetical protein